jgi:hypothetical protein
MLENELIGIGKCRGIFHGGGFLLLADLVA